MKLRIQTYFAQTYAGGPLPAFLEGFYEKKTEKAVSFFVLKFRFVHLFFLLIGFSILLVNEFLWEIFVLSLREKNDVSVLLGETVTLWQMLLNKYCGRNECFFGDRFVLKM